MKLGITTSQAVSTNQETVPTEKSERSHWTYERIRQYFGGTLCEHIALLRAAGDDKRTRMDRVKVIVKDIRALNDAGKIPSKAILMDFFRFVMPGLEKMAEEEFDKVTQMREQNIRVQVGGAVRTGLRVATAGGSQDPSGPPSSGGGIAAELREELSAIARNIRFAQKNDNPEAEADRESRAMQEELHDAQRALRVALAAMAKK